MTSVTGGLFVRMEGVYDKLCSGDFNGDGLIDIIAMGSASNALAYVGQPGLTFQRRNTTLPPSSRLAAGDFDGDGKLDVVLSFADQSTLAIYRGDGNFGFTLDTELTSTGLAASTLAVGDLNLDGRPDIAVCNAFSANVTIFRSRAEPGYTVGTLPVGSNPIALRIVDINQDLKPDLIVANGASRTLTLAYGTGTGTFSSRTTISLGLTPANLTTGDFNRDGRPDIAVGCLDRVTLKPLLLVPSTAAGFGAVVAYGAVDAEIPDLASTDLNADGFDDLVCLTFTQSIDTYTRVLVSSGAGTFDPPESSYSPSARKLICADFDEDGFVEAVTGTNDSFSVVPIENGIPLGVRSFRPSSHVSPLTFGDLNNDGINDLIQQYYESSASEGFAISFGLGGDSYADPTVYLQDSRVYSAITSDLNRDGYADLVMCADHPTITSATRMLVSLNQGNGTFGPVQIYGNSAALTSVAAADLNGDGFPELLSTSRGNSTNAGVARMMRNNGDGTFVSPFVLDVYERINRVLVADFDKDGWNDFAIFRDLDNILMFWNNHNYTFSVEYINGFYYDGAVAALNRDGLPDLAICQFGSVESWVNNGDRTFTPYVKGENSAPYRIAAADYNGDGVDDISWGSDWTGGLMINSGNGTAFASSNILTTRAQPFDYDNDGDIDLTFSMYAHYLGVIDNRTSDKPGPLLLGGAYNVDSRSVSLQMDSNMFGQSIQANELTIRNRTTGATTSALSVQLNPTGRQLTFGLPPLPDGDYEFSLAAKSVISADGLTNRQPIVLHDSTTFILAGDLNRDRRVDFDDLLTLAQNYGQTGKTFSQGNIDYSADGLVGFDDLLMLSQRYGTALQSFPSADRRKRAGTDLRILDFAR